MQGPRAYGSDPDRDGGLFGRLRELASSLLERGGGRQQALPLDRYHGAGGPVVPYQERRQQLLRHRRERHSSYALVFIAVLLVLVVGLFYGLTWVLGGGLPFGGSRSRTPTPGAQTIATASTASTPGTAALPTPGSGASPSPSPQLSGSPATSGPGTPGPGATPTPAGQTYTVKPGDTPGSIARQFGIPTDVLMRANNITDARALKPGDRLQIPPASTPTPPIR
jgi:LysM repeat protein